MMGMMTCASQVWGSAVYVSTEHGICTNTQRFVAVVIFSTHSVSPSFLPFSISIEMKIFSWPLGGESKPSTVSELNRRPNHPDLNITDI